jgi:hypothetical protein
MAWMPLLTASQCAPAMALGAFTEGMTSTPSAALSVRRHRPDSQVCPPPTRRNGRQKGRLGSFSSTCLRLPCQAHTVLMDNGNRLAEQPRNWNTIYSRPMRLYMICKARGIEHRLTKPIHPWTICQVRQVNRTIKGATVKRDHYDGNDQLRTPLDDFPRSLHLCAKAEDPDCSHTPPIIRKVWVSKSDRPDPQHSGTEQLAPIRAGNSIRTGAPISIWPAAPLSPIAHAPATGCRLPHRGHSDPPLLWAKAHTPCWTLPYPPRQGPRSLRPSRPARGG